MWRSYGRQSDSLVIGGSMLPAKKLISKYRLNRFLQSENQINHICSGKKQFRMQIFVQNQCHPPEFLHLTRCTELSASVGGSLRSVAQHNTVTTDKKVLTEPLQKVNFFSNLKDEGNTSKRQGFLNTEERLCTLNVSSLENI